MSAAVYREFRPDQRLAPFVECDWLRSGSATPSLRVIPDGCVDVFVTAQGDVTIAGPAHTFYDLPAGAPARGSTCACCSKARGWSLVRWRWATW